MCSRKVSNCCLVSSSTWGISHGRKFGSGKIDITCKTEKSLNTSSSLDYAINFKNIKKAKAKLEL
jgi:hypothetical protein